MRQQRQDRANPPIGQKFGKLTVIGFGGRTRHGVALWKCQCDCGRFTLPRANAVACGRSTRCRPCAAKGNAGGSTARYGERDASFALMFSQGQSFGDIAFAFDVTRSTVAGAIGRYRRKGLLDGRTLVREAA